jgi:hypothetical protein
MAMMRRRRPANAETPPRQGFSWASASRQGCTVSMSPGTPSWPGFMLATPAFIDAGRDNASQ